MKKKIYVAPEVEVIEVKVEQGFAQSVEPNSSSIEDLLYDENETPW